MLIVRQQDLPTASSLLQKSSKIVSGGRRLKTCNFFAGFFYVLIFYLYNAHLRNTSIPTFKVKF